MTVLQKKLLDMLKIIDDICRRHDIDYFLTAGTLIGAVRHQGFIPWDDDADIIMSRDNWKKFHDVAPAELPDYLNMNCQDDDVDMAMTVTHVTDTRTAGIYRFNVIHPEIAGFVIDIIIMDPVPDTPEARETYVNAVTEHSDFTNWAYPYATRTGHSANFRANVEAMRKEGKRAVVDRIDSVAFNYSEEESQLYAQRLAGAPHFWPKESYGKPKYVPFEDTMLPVPQRADDILSIGYDDDWMYVPSGAGSRQTHEFAVHNDNMSSEKIYEDFEANVDRKELEDVYYRRKLMMDETTEERTNLWKSKDPYHAARMQLVYREKLKGVDLAGLVRDRNYEELAELLDEYIVFQCNGHFLGRPTLAGWMNWDRKCRPFLIDIGDEAFYAVLILLLHQKKLGVVGKLLRARKLLDRPLTPELAQVDTLYADTRTARSHMEIDDYETAAAAMAKWEGVRADIPHVAALLLKTAMHTGAPEEEIQARLAEGLENFPEDPELLYIQAERCLKEAPEEAIQIFRTIADTSTFGPALLGIKQYLEARMESGDTSEDTLMLYCDVIDSSGIPVPPVDDALLLRICQILLQKKRLYLVRRFLNGRRGVVAPFPRNLQEIDELTKDLRRAISSYRRKDLEECREIVDLWKPIRAEVPYLTILDTKLRLEEAETPENAMALITDALDQFPEDEELLFLRLKEEEKSHDLAAALETCSAMMQAGTTGSILFRVKTLLEEGFPEAQAETEAALAALEEQIENEHLPARSLVGDISPITYLDDVILEDEETKEVTIQIPEDEVPGVGRVPVINKALCPDVVALDRAQLEERQEEIKQRKLALLNDVAEICQEEGIRYYISSNLLMYALKRKHIDDAYVAYNVMIDQKDIPRFIEAVERKKPEGRYLDGMCTNPEYPNLNLQYRETDSLDFFTDRNATADRSGLYINIIILRRESAFKLVETFRGVLENGWERQFNAFSMGRKAKFSKSFVGFLISVLGQERTGKLLFRRLVRSPLIPRSDTVYYKLRRRKRTRLDAEIMKKQAYVELEGRYFPTFYRFDLYMNDRYGKNWRRKSLNKTTLKYNHLMDTRITGPEYFDYLNSVGIDREAMAKARYDLSVRNTELPQLNKQIRAYWELMAVCGDRYLLAEEYLPQKKHIRELLDAGDLDALKEVFRSYMKAVNHYRKYKIGVFFDQDILDYLVEYLRADGREQKAQNLLDRIALGNWKPVELPHCGGEE